MMISGINTMIKGQGVVGIVMQVVTVQCLGIYFGIFQACRIIVIEMILRQTYMAVGCIKFRCSINKGTNTIGYYGLAVDMIIG